MGEMSIFGKNKFYKKQKNYKKIKITLLKQRLLENYNLRGGASKT